MQMRETPALSMPRHSNEGNPSTEHVHWVKSDILIGNLTLHDSTFVLKLRHRLDRVTHFKVNGAFPKLRLSKLNKLAKKLITDQNFGGSRTQALGL